MVGIFLLFLSSSSSSSRFMYLGEIESLSTWWGQREREADPWLTVEPDPTPLRS